MTKQASPLRSGSIIGILGTGQLGRMLSLAGAQLGFKTHIYGPEENAPASEVSLPLFQKQDIVILIRSGRAAFRI